MAQIVACRDKIKKLWEGSTGLEKTCAHAGLLLARCLQEHDSSKEKVRTLLRVAGESVRRAASLYGPAYERWEKTLRDCLEYPCHHDVFSIQGRMVIGLGGASVLETGLTLHHTYGIPVIPGSALKGLAAHYCDQVWGEDSGEVTDAMVDVDSTRKKFKRSGKYFEAIFGSQDDAGHITFHDAWMTPRSMPEALQPDVMTPHHQAYYGAPESSNEHPPTDFDDPIPVSFLSITGNFLVALTCDVPGEKGQQWVDLAFQLLKRALNDWGIGGKTNSGYGRMIAASEAATGSAGGYAGSGSRQVEQQPPTPKYKRGDRVQVTRVEDTKKGKKRFQADDGFAGVVAYGEPPDIGIGETTMLWVASATKDDYNFASHDLDAGKKKQGHKEGRDRRDGRR